MVRHNWFEHHEAAEIKGLIDELHGGDAKQVRARLRTEYGFYVADHGLDATGVAIETDDDEAFRSQEDGSIAVRDRDGARCWFPSGV